MGDVFIMNNMIDLTLLAQDTIDIKFDEETVFRIPPEPTIGFSTKMVLYKEKMKRAKSDEAKLKILAEVVTFILEQDDSHDNVAELVEQMHPSQVEAVFNIYENQAVENNKNPN